MICNTQFDEDTYNIALEYFEKGNNIQYRIIKEEKEEYTKDENINILLSMIRIGYKQMAKINHPDVNGGSEQKMAQINTLKTQLEQLIKEIV